MGFFGGGGGAAPADMVGATSSVAGTAGLVPAPAAGSEYAYLRGDATFKNPLIQQSFINTTQEGYNSAPLGLNTAGAAVPADNTLYLIPHIVIPTTYTTIALRRASGTAGATMKTRMGVYECDFDKLCPTTLILETADTSMANSTSDVSVAISQTLNKGIYFLACVFTGSSGWSGTTTVRSGNQHGVPFWGTLSGSLEFRMIAGLQMSHTYGALPSSITASSLAFNGANPLIAFLRK